jgi:hypothetical protein
VVWGFLQAFDAMALVPLYWMPVVWVLAQGVAALFGWAGSRSNAQ